MTFTKKLDLETTAGIIGIVLVALALVAVIIFAPIAVAASLNTLFPVLAIPYNFWTWLAVSFLWFVAKVSISVNK